MSCHLFLASLQKNIEIAFQNKNRQFSIGMVKTKNKR
jgi:hypothetical protein